MLKRDKIIVSLVAMQAIIAGLYLTLGTSEASPPPEPLSVAPAAVIGTKGGLRGYTNAPYTLVEFGDYQCPPCARAHPNVVALLAQHSQQLRFQFRHFPLTQIHPFAQKAALVAELSRSDGNFWKVHDALYKLSPQMDDAALSKMEQDEKVDGASKATIAEADARVSADTLAAQRLKINSTPSFVLCCPDGKVLKLSSISQAETYIK